MLPRSSAAPPERKRQTSRHIPHPIAAALITRLQACVSPERFDEAADDRVAKGDWNELVSVPDLILLEGWCVGISGQQQQESGRPRHHAFKRCAGNGTLDALFKSFGKRL